eukprot:118099_1
MMNVLDHALPNEDSQRTSQQVYGSSMLGQVVREFGYNRSQCGHSGKSLRSSLSLATLGRKPDNYGMRASKYAFTKKQDRATYAQMDRVRLLVIEEAHRHNPLDGNDLDRQTGCESYTARGFNTAKSHNDTHLTIIINSNDEITQSIRPFKKATKDRALVIEYKNEYVIDDDDVDEENGKYLRNAKYSNKEWINEMKPYFFHYMADRCKQYIDD